MTFRGFTEQIPAADFGPPTGEVSVGAAEAEGTGDAAAREDHVHAVPAAAAGAGATTSLPGDTEADGTAGTPARSDHRHGREAAPAIAAAPTIALGTVYQNTGAAALHLLVPIIMTPSSSNPIYIDLGVSTTNPPTPTGVIELSAGAPQQEVPVSFVVPPGCYYELTATLNGGTAEVGTVQAVTL